MQRDPLRASEMDTSRFDTRELKSARLGQRFGFKVPKNRSAESAIQPGLSTKPVLSVLSGPVEAITQGKFKSAPLSEQGAGFRPPC